MRWLDKNIPRIVSSTIPRVNWTRIIAIMYPNCDVKCAKMQQHFQTYPPLLNAYKPIIHKWQSWQKRREIFLLIGYTLYAILLFALALSLLPSRTADCVKYSISIHKWIMELPTQIENLHLKPTFIICAVKLTGPNSKWQLHAPTKNQRQQNQSTGIFSHNFANLHLSESDDVIGNTF